MTVGLSGKQVTYDYNNRPTNVVFGGQTTVYTYGPDGARQTKTVGGVETFYASMVEIRDLGGANEQLILQPHPDFRLVDGVASYLHRDHLSSVRLITNAAGQVAQSTSYTPYGDPTTANLQASTFEEHSFIGERYPAYKDGYYAGNGAAASGDGFIADIALIGGGVRWAYKAGRAGVSILLGTSATAAERRTIVTAGVAVAVRPHGNSKKNMRPHWLYVLESTNVDSFGEIQKIGIATSYCQIWCLRFSGHAAA